MLKMRKDYLFSILIHVKGGYRAFWLSPTFGFFGLSISVVTISNFFLQTKPLSVTYGLGISDHDSEGRLVTAEFDSFFLLSGYVPNSGDGLRRLVSIYFIGLFRYTLASMIF